MVLVTNWTQYELAEGDVMVSARWWAQTISCTAQADIYIEVDSFLPDAPDASATNADRAVKKCIMYLDVGATVG
jgi:hypothetical protein